MRSIRKTGTWVANFSRRKKTRTVIIGGSLHILFAMLLFFIILLPEPRGTFYSFILNTFLFFFMLWYMSSPTFERFMTAAAILMLSSNVGFVLTLLIDNIFISHFQLLFGDGYLFLVSASLYTFTGMSAFAVALAFTFITYFRQKKDKPC